MGIRGGGGTQHAVEHTKPYPGKQHRSTNGHHQGSWPVSLELAVAGHMPRQTVDKQADAMQGFAFFQGELVVMLGKLQVQTAFSRESLLSVVTTICEEMTPGEKALELCSKRFWIGSLENVLHIGLIENA